MKNIKQKVKHCFVIDYANDADMNRGRLSIDGFSSYIDHITSVETDFSPCVLTPAEREGSLFNIKESTYRYCSELLMSKEEFLKLRQRIMELPTSLNTLFNPKLNWEQRIAIDKQRKALFSTLQSSICMIQAHQFVNGQWQEVFNQNFVYNDTVPQEKGDPEIYSSTNSCGIL